jgi:hypothetical protein
LGARTVQESGQRVEEITFGRKEGVGDEDEPSSKTTNRMKIAQRRQMENWPRRMPERKE